MGAFEKIKRTLTLMCVIYTVIISAMFLLGWVISDSASLFVPTPAKALLMLLFSFILGLASLCLKRERTSALRLIIHYLICVSSFFVTFVIGGGFSLTGGTSITALIAFTAIYAVVMAFRAVVRRKRKGWVSEPEEYTSMLK